MDGNRICRSGRRGKTPGTVVVPGVFHPHDFPVAAPQKRPRLFLSKHTRKKSEMSRVNAKKFEIFFHRAAMASRKSISDVFQPKILRG